MWYSNVSVLRCSVLFMFVESLFHPFTSKYQTAKCICPNCQMYFFLQNCKMYLSCWCIIYVCWEPFSSIQIKIFEEKTLANWIILQRRIKVKLLIEFSKYNTIVQIWCQTQSKWLATRKYNIFEEWIDTKCICLQDVLFQCTIPFTKTFVCLSIFQMFECFFPNQVSIQMFAAVSVLGWFSIIL